MQIPNAGRQYFLPYSPDRQSFIGLYKCFNERLNQWISSPIDYNNNKIRLKNIIMYIKNIKKYNNASMLTTAVSILACILLVPYKEKSYLSLEENLGGNICEKVSRIHTFHTLFVFLYVYFSLAGCYICLSISREFQALLKYTHNSK